jgi:hypothetical protein
MTSNSYSWDSLNIEYKGLLTHDHRMKDSTGKLYLISYIGRGATSKVYRCITGDGYSCVAKIYVNRRCSDNKIMSETAFQTFSGEKVSEELTNLENIYGSTELKGYFWSETLNNRHCIIMPFFEPIKKDQRKSDDVMNGIRQQLHLFIENGKKYRASDQLWRHVGYFNNKIYLFDLGDLIGIYDDVSQTEKDGFIDEHMSRLKTKANVSTNFLSSLLWY